MVADLIVINTQKPWYYPKHNVKSAIVYSGNSSDVEFVIIDGRIITEKGQVLTLDEEQIYMKSKGEQRELCLSFHGYSL